MKLYQILMFLVVIMMIFIDSRQCNHTSEDEDSEEVSSYPPYGGEHEHGEFCVDCAVNQVADQSIGTRAKLGARLIAGTVTDLSRKVVKTVKGFRDKAVPKVRELIKGAKPIIKKAAGDMLEGADLLATGANEVIGQQMAQVFPGKEREKEEKEGKSEQFERKREHSVGPTSLKTTGTAGLGKIRRHVVSTAKKFYNSVAKKAGEAGKWESTRVLGLPAPLASIFYPFLVSSVLAYFVFSQARFVTIFNRLVFVAIVHGLSECLFGSKLVRVLIQAFTFGVFILSVSFEIMKVIAIALVSIATWVFVWVRAEPTRFLTTPYASGLYRKIDEGEPLSGEDVDLVKLQERELDRHNQEAEEVAALRKEYPSGTFF